MEAKFLLERFRMSVTLLVIDEDAALVKSLERTFQFCGYKVLSASDGMKGVQKAIRHKPDLIIIDPRLAGLEAHSLFKNLKRSLVTRAIPVLIHTDRLDASSNRFLETAPGNRTFVRKPSDREHLLFQTFDLLSTMSSGTNARPDEKIVASGDFKSPETPADLRVPHKKTNSR